MISTDQSYANIARTTILANFSGVAVMFVFLFVLVGRAVAAEPIIVVPGTRSGSSTPDYAAGRGARETLYRGQERPLLPKLGPDQHRPDRGRTVASCQGVCREIPYLSLM